MANDRIQVKITADDKQFTSTMSRIQAKAKASETNISKLGTAVSGVGFAFGSATGKAGQWTSELGALAGVLGSGGILSVGIVGAVAAIGLMTKAWLETSEAIKKAREEGEKYISNVLNKIEKSKFRELGLKGAEAGLHEARSERRALEFEMGQLMVRAEGLRQSLGKIITTGSSVAKRRELADIYENQLPQVRQKIVAHEAWITRLKRDAANERGAEALKIMSNYQAELVKLETEAEARRKAAFEKYMADVEARVNRYFNRLKRGREEAAEAEAFFDEGARAWREQDEKDDIKEMQRRADAEAELVEKQIQAAERQSELQNEAYEARRAAETELGQTGVYWAEQAQAVYLNTASIMASAASEQGRLWGQMIAAQEAGDKDRYKELQKMERDHWSMVGASVLDSLSQQAIGEGTIMAAKGMAAFLTTGNAGGLAAAGIGAGLVAAGIGGTITSGAWSGYVGAAGGSASTGTSAPTTRAPTTSVAPGPQADSGPTVINYYFGGPVFGNEDDAARAVAGFNVRGRQLEGMAS